ncbi:hypothetical protein OF83DRAFT_1113395 [Amylostereum chailletii]|nr:hypothetical protein OF83DRAFT_1113395 [Amylostereum chailletii]
MVQYGHPIQPRPTIKKPLLSRFLRPKTVREERGSLPVIEAKMQEIGAGAQEHHHHKKDIRHIPVDEFEVEAEMDDQATVELPDDELRFFVVDSVEPSPTLPPPKKEALPKVLKPHVWAQSRQEVCESYDHFRSYQGGVYFNKDVARGYLLSAFSSSRDKFHREGRLIISHGGGKAEAFHTHNGRMEREAATDQSSEDKSVRALLNNYYSRRPLVLLADDKYALFPYDLTAAGYTYVVLGFYWITNAWAECQHVEENGSKVVRFKFAFQWCEEQGDPWWCMRPQSEGTAGPQSQGEASPAVVKNEETGEVFLPFSALPNEQRCDRCCRTSIQVYEIGWMCLTPKCPSFWIHEGKMPTSDLEYSRRFLDTAPVRKGHPCTTDKLLPSPPPSHSVGGVVTTRQFARGMYCRKCGRLSSRARWDCWECKGCRAVHRVTGMIRDHKQFWTQLSKLDFYDHTITRGSGIWAEPTRFITFKEDGENRRLMVQTFTLPHNRGKIHIIPGSVLTNGKANGIFSEYQEMANKGEIDFRRWPMRAHRCRGELLTNYFSQNTGAPYKYVGGAGRTVPLEDGPSAVRHALRLMKRRIRHALGRKIPFNEVLSAAYMERQKMAFHSDSERGLGPVVASLSLGSVALMHFRLHPQHATSPALRKTALTIAIKHVCAFYYLTQSWLTDTWPG